MTYQAALQSLNALLSRPLAIQDNKAAANSLLAASNTFFHASNRAEESGESATPQQRQDLERWVAAACVNCAAPALPLLQTRYMAPALLPQMHSARCSRAGGTERATGGCGQPRHRGWRGRRASVGSALCAGQL
jgi:hypothetical protein